MVEIKKDIFICHASKDKIDIIYPLIEAFDNHGISYWFDKAEIRWGDKLISRINEGLRISKYVIVILSANFLLKNWPQTEFEAALNIEISSGEIKVLPLIVGSEEERKEILERYPIINSKKYLTWGSNIDNIVNELLLRLEKRNTYLEKSNKKQEDFDLPKIKKKFSDREKDVFLKNAFEELKKYFQHGLRQIEKEYNEAETDFIEINKFKFVCKIFMKGEIANQCKIWIGGLTSDSIAYTESNFDVYNDNSMNGVYTVETNDYEIGFKPLSMFHIDDEFKDIELLNEGQLSRSIWKRFLEPIS
jgi:hypothetical protein